MDEFFGMGKTAVRQAFRFSERISARGFLDIPTGDCINANRNLFEKIFHLCIAFDVDVLVIFHICCAIFFFIG
jgi:hypothetical protein